MQFRFITAILASVAVGGVVAKDQAAQADPPADAGLESASLAVAAAAAPAKDASKEAAKTDNFFGGGNFGGLVPDTINVNVQPPPGGLDCFNYPNQFGCAGRGWNPYNNNNNYCYNNYYAPGCPGNPGRGGFGPSPAFRPVGCPTAAENCNYCRYGPAQFGPGGWGQPQYVCPNQYYGYQGCECFYY